MSLCVSSHKFVYLTWASWIKTMVQELLTGQSYIIRTERPQHAFAVLKKTLLKTNFLVVTRCPDDEVCSIFGKKAINSIWLTNIPTEKKHLRPQEIEQLCYDVEQFMKQNEGSYVFFSAVEYLISFSTFKEVFHLLQNLRDFALLHNNVFILSIGNGTLEQQQEKLFLQEFSIMEDEE